MAEKGPQSQAWRSSLSSATDWAFQSRSRPLVLLLLILALWVFIQNAWLGDDCYITFRTIDNFATGHGLRWNPVERVQTYTHPLWMLLNLLLHTMTRELYYTPLALSAVLTVGTLCLLGLSRRVRPVTAVVVLMVLLSSRAFVDYTSSGLENPLLHLLLALFAWVYFRHEEDEPPLLVLFLITSAIMMTRLDALLIVLPALGLVVWNQRSWRLIPIALLGFAPFVAWEVFSLLYYGFPLPNTAYAKLGTGLSWPSLFEQGFRYYAACMRTDFVTLPWIATILAICAFRWRSMYVRALAIGILLYLVYILRIGGDFMSGRFFAAPFLMATAIFAFSGREPGRRTLAITATCVLAIVVLHDGNPVRTGKHYYDDIPPEDRQWGFGIEDERAFYHRGSNPLWASESGPMPDHQWANWGREYRASQVVGTAIGTGMGMRPYFTGPLVHYVGRYGLTDPLLSRLPVHSRVDWRVGHFLRRMPKGYYDGLRSQSNLIEDPQLSRYYTTLCLITRGPIFHPQRLRTIVEMNLGRFDRLLDDERARIHAGWEKLELEASRNPD